MTRQSILNDFYNVLLHKEDNKFKIAFIRVLVNNGLIKQYLKHMNKRNCVKQGSLHETVEN